MSETPMATAREVAIAAARDAGSILRERLGQHRDIQFKGVVDLVTDADRAAEAAIAARIRDAFPDHRILGEEGARGERPATDAALGWIIDPLDGTTNYAHGFPHFAVSIGLERAGTVVLGVIYDPLRDELFVAERGRGASLNGVPVRVSGTDDLIRSLLATGFPYDLARRTGRAEIWGRFLVRCQSIRGTGSAALNLAYVAVGRLDGVWEDPLQPWDMAAGSLLVEEAGGKVSDIRGGAFAPYGTGIVATNGALHAAMLAVIADRG
ncbi:MAG: Inositol-1-monophosphatase [uncultured Thermomicrobiales bacterium]|uniref:Inositol-1-monophosphatase n=1 Tax=uncultured Thermomicrobiales bacterium TaxID=1645740 RepID=A0A6J4UIU4_9BACT|nr:MAG: Inositol-1-monophosphatase [uncultured Thermomicrobiales bacterium]